jgi:FkbM family methyltransferase
MINEAIGERVEIDGNAYLKTRPNALGHAIYGPYERLGVGNYMVEYSVTPIQKIDIEGDLICAAIDVACNRGATIVARSLVYYLPILKDDKLCLFFNITEEHDDLEYRVYVNSVVSLLISDRPRVTRVIKNEYVPPISYSSSSSFLNDNTELFTKLFLAGMQVKIVGGGAILTASDVSFHARCGDDMNFIGEIFFENVYNLMMPRAACLIDIGMNIGFTSLRLATREEIKEVYAFEPFKSTFNRAAANVILNPVAAAKIHMNNVGLSDRDQELRVLIDTDDSGSYSVIGSHTGEAVTIQIRDAATVLAPIINSATRKGRMLIVKLDCEGSEFAVFKSLSAVGLLEKIAVFMVEWHLGWGNYSELTVPLIKRGFAIIDRSPRSGGNGFFYAVKTAL